MRAFVLTLAILASAAAGALAQNTKPDPAALADIRQELIRLLGDIQSLQAELRTTTQPNSPTAVADTPTVLRAARLEEEVRGLTGQVEQLAFRISRIAEDGTRRIQDLEFRLVELEGGDITALADTPLLGGAVPEGQGISTSPLTTTPPDAPQLAVAEQSDFDVAMVSLGEGNTTAAIEQFRAFLADYPGGPLAAEAMFHLGEAETQEANHKKAARAFLDSFTAAPQGPFAAAALMRVGVALGHLGQKQEACQTLNEVLIRYPGHPVEAETQSNIAAMGCT